MQAIDEGANAVIYTDADNSAQLAQIGLLLVRHGLDPGGLARNEAIEQVPFAFIDSFAESASTTQGPMTTWETLLFGLCKAVRRHGFAQGPAAEMVNLIEEEIGGHEDLN